MLLSDILKYKLYYFCLREPYTNVNRWFDTIVNQPKVVKVIGKFEYCQKTPEFNQKTYSELHGGSAEKKPQAKKEKAPKKAAAPKEVVQEEEPDAADLILAAEPKSSNPFDALPKGYCIIIYIYIHVNIS